MTREEIAAHGYRAYRPSDIDPPGVAARYQKRFDDERGKKYFIDIKEWKAWRHPYTGETYGTNYEFEVQLYAKPKREPINLCFFAGWTIERVEQHIEKLFSSGDYEYYELWED